MLTVLQAVAAGFANITASVTSDIALLGSLNPFDVACDEAAISIALTKVYS